MVDRINLHGRADLRGYPGAGRQGSEGRHRRCRGRHRGVFHAYASLLAQEADGRNDSEDERYPAKRGRNHGGCRKIGHKAHNNAVLNIWSDQRVIYHDMDHTADCVGIREVHVFLRRLPIANRFYHRTVLQPRSDFLDHFYDNWQHLLVPAEIRRRCVHDASSINVNGAVSIYGGKALDIISRLTELSRQISKRTLSFERSIDGERIKKIVPASKYCFTVSVM